MGREDKLAAEFERVAAALRDGEAAVYGYDVDPDAPAQRGAVAYSGGWLAFEFEG